MRGEIDIMETGIAQARAQLREWALRWIADPDREFLHRANRSLGTVEFLERARQEALKRELGW